MINMDDKFFFSGLQTILYIYRMTNDTGFAPCVDDGLLTLACCKGGRIRKGKPERYGIRYWIGSGRDHIDIDRDNVFVIGLYGGKLLYLARISSTMKMTKYYSGISNGRLDDIYSVEDGKDELKWKGIRGIADNKIHGNDPKQQKRDEKGEYVLLSNEYIYLGNKSDNMPDIPLLMEYAPHGQRHAKYMGEVAKKIGVNHFFCVIPDRGTTVNQNS